MNILVVGAGGREHALVWKLKQSPRVRKIYCAPGNAGIGSIAELVAIKTSDARGLLGFAQRASIDLTVVGPEQPLTEGIVDLFMKHEMRIFGPTKTAATLEGSKTFAKQFMKKHNIPTAEWRSFDLSERYEARRYLAEQPVPIVIKADGLAAGKGAVVCETQDQAFAVLDMMMEKKIFGRAGERVVIEEFMVGEEASVFALTDGETFVMLPSAQDHKRILDGDQGKNTGGMGSYAPAPLITIDLMDRIERTIVKPTILGMSKEKRTYRGCLYCGLMITETGPKVVEFNCRFGDPEAQVVLPLLDFDLVEVMIAVCDGKLSPGRVRFHDASAVCIVVASGGYPDSYETRKPIFGLDSVVEEDGTVVFHGGTTVEKDTVVTSGGRVLGVTALGYKDDLEEAAAQAYRAVEKITFDGAYYRSDIGRKGIERLKSIRA
ncbi:MAG: phosphoribosylamine--glycine ligase [Bacteroidota bacterium]